MTDEQIYRAIAEEELKKYITKGEQATFMGVLLKDLSKEALIGFVGWCGECMKKQEEQHSKIVEMFQDINYVLRS